MTLSEFKKIANKHGISLSGNIFGSRITIEGNSDFILNDVDPRYKIDTIEVDGEIEFKNAGSSYRKEKGNVAIRIPGPINTNIIFNNEGDVVIESPVINSRLEFNNKGNVYIGYQGDDIKIIPDNLKFNNGGNVTLLTDNIPSGFEFNNGKEVALPYIKDTNLIESFKKRGVVFGLNLKFASKMRVKGIDRSRLTSWFNKRILGMREPHERN